MKPNILDLDPLFRDDAVEFLRQLNGTAYKFTMSQVKRTKLEQEALWSQGRDTWEMTNAKRAKVGWNPITAQESKKRVTKTMKSKHLANAQGFSEAFDIVAVDRLTGNAIWNDETHLGKPYKLAFDISRGFPMFKAGYEWGWDLGHYELKEGIA
jgi:hypothetical protein